MCDIGGTLDTTVSYRREKKIYADPERQFGRESRSLKAAYELLQVGDAGFMSKQGGCGNSTSAQGCWACVHRGDSGGFAPCMLQTGWSAKNMLFVDGGVQQWRYQGLDME